MVAQLTGMSWGFWPPGNKPADLAQGPMNETKREEKREREGENVDFICLLVTVLIN